MRIPAQGPERQKIKLIVRKYQGPRKAKTVERIHMRIAAAAEMKRP